MRVTLFSLLLLLHSTATLAIPVGAPLEFDTPQQEALYQSLIRELRCTVCQNQSLVDSNASLAHDLRRHTYEMVRGGAERAEILDFMVARYGEFVLYRPPLRGATLMLWFGPFLLLGIALAVLLMVARERGRHLAERPSALTSDEQARLQRLLGGSDRHQGG